MAIKYNRLTSKYKIIPLGTVALSSGAADLKVIDITAAGALHFNCIAVVVAGASLSGALTINIKGNTATNGSGTDYVIATKVLGASDDELTLEIDNEIISYIEDQNGGLGTFKSIVIDATGTGTDSFDAALVYDHDHNYNANTPTDS